VTRFVRFRFSLATLLLVLTLSAVVLWLNTRSQVTHGEIALTDLQTGTQTVGNASLGWPWCFAVFFSMSTSEIEQVEFSYSALAYDAVVALLLIVVLTWASNQLLRRVTSRLRRGRFPADSPN
jgi:hypothetical protein